MVFAFFRDIRDALVSLRLTVVLLALSIVLVLAATLDQVNIGIWAVQKKYFHTFAVLVPVGGIRLAVFPGGYLIGGLLLINLIAAHVGRFRCAWRQLGIHLTHGGLILLLIGELLTGLWQREYYLRLDEGQTGRYVESYRQTELAISEISDPTHDEVVAFSEGALRPGTTLQHPLLPFRVEPKSFFPNADIRMREAGAASGAAHGATGSSGFGSRLLATALPVTHQPNERNLPAASVALVAAEGPLGTWLVSPILQETQRFESGGRTWTIALRFAREYLPFSLTLLNFTHDRYPGTEIPKNFSSRLLLTTPAEREGREVVVRMNHPLRHGGLTFYQAGFENNDRTSILQVVRNPSWQLPYVACAIMALGLLIQFGLHLIRFARRGTPQGARQLEGSALPRLAPRAASARRWLPAAGAAGAALLLAVSPLLRRDADPFALGDFGRLPTLVNGRIKPLDTVARTSLLLLQGRQRTTIPGGQPIQPAAWLLDMLFRPERADTYPVFEIVHPEVLSLVRLTPGAGAGGKRFSYVQLRPSLPEIERQGRQIAEIEAALRTPFQRAALRLRDNLLLYQRIQYSLLDPADPALLPRLAALDREWEAAKATRAARHAGQPAEAAAVQNLGELSRIFATLDAFGYLRPIPPAEKPADPAGWTTAGAAWSRGLATGSLSPTLRFYLQLADAWRAQDPARFNALVVEQRTVLSEMIPGRLGRSDVEAAFNRAQPFYTSAVLYVAAFLLAVLSWLRWAGALRRAAVALVASAFVLATVGIVVRMWLEGRPPVTNLYSSALFVGWAAVALCLGLEMIHRNAIASVAAGLIGFSTLLIAHHLAMSGDTLEMMRAVLDSNFWLATHVVTVTMGYSAMFLAGFLALIYVTRGVFTRSRDAATAASLTRMVYGVLCFATLFSFTGTVLGGIWADQSWGRFWGWDPKENGALMIVLWCALALHARWGGLVQARGLMNLAIFGNIITAWSWFGVNMLGVGLHSYGFMDAAFWSLIIFAASQLLMIGLSLVARPARAPSAASAARAATTN